MGPHLALPRDRRGWLVTVATGRTDPPPALRATGRLSLLAAAGLGTVRLVGELTGILGAA